MKLNEMNRMVSNFNKNGPPNEMGFFSVVVELNYCNNSKRKRKKEKEKGGGGELSVTCVA
jgi:hypothetical protein